MEQDTRFLFFDGRGFMKPNVGRTGTLFSCRVYDDINNRAMDSTFLIARVERVTVS